MLVFIHFIALQALFGDKDDEDEDEVGNMDLRSSKTSRAKMSTSSSSTAMGDFGGDYGNYLKLLEGDSALGFNPQKDPVYENQVISEG